MIRPSPYRVNASRITDTTVSLPAGDIQAGDHVACYGMGPFTQLSVPPIPPIAQPPSNRLVRFAYVSDACGTGPASAAVGAPESGLVSWAVAPDPGTRWIVAWTSDDGVAWSFAGATCAHPRGLGGLAGLTVQMRLTPGIVGPSWLPQSPPDTATRDRVLTTIASIDAQNVATLDGTIEASGFLCYDAAPLVTGSLPIGRFQCHRDVEVTSELRGVKARWGDVLGETTELRFEDGRGLHATTVDVEISRIAISSQTRLLPAQDVAAPLRPGTEWQSGALVLIEKLATLSEVHVSNACGVGVAVLAGLAGFTNNANLSVLNRVQISSCTGHGLFVDGSDANACNISSLHVAGCGGWGVLDESLLGSSYTAPHASANKLGAYYANAGSFFHPYSESGVQKTSYFGVNVTVSGGTHGATPEGPSTLVGRSAKWLQLGPSTHQTIFGHHQPAYANLLRRYEGTAHRFHKREFQGAIEDYASHTGYAAKRHHGQNLRGYGLIEFPRGVLLSPTVRLVAVNPSNWPAGTYAPTDFVIDSTTGERIAITAPFGVGPARVPNAVYRVGDVVTQGAEAFVCSATAAPLGSRCANAPMTIADATVDGGVTWALWGPAGAP